MDSLSKFKLLSELEKINATVKIISVRGEEFTCKLLGFAEDEEDWAYDIITTEKPPRYFTIECNYIAEIHVMPV